MKILQLTHSFPSTHGSNITPFVKYFCEALAADPAMEVHLLAPEAPGLVAENVTIHTFRPAKNDRVSHKRIGKDANTIPFSHQCIYFIRAVLAARRLIAQYNFDVVHAHWAIPSGIVARVAIGSRDIPYVVTTHGRDVLDMPAVGYNTPSHIILGRLVKFALLGARQIITTSPSTDHFCKKIVPDARTKNIPVGIDSNWLAKFKTPSTGEALLFVGDLIPWKGLSLLFEALLLSPSLKKQEVLVVGAGADSQELKEFCRLNGLSCVKFLGAMKHEDLPAVFCQAKILVMPSLIEGFGIVVLEALAAGLQVLGSDVGIMPTLKQNNVFSSYVNVVDCQDSYALKSELERLLKTFPKSQYSTLKRELENTYSWESIGQEHKRFYQMLGKNNESI